MNTKAHMTLLALEILGDSTSSAETTHALDHPLSFKTATLRAVDVHAPGSALTQSWTTTHTGDTSGSTRTVYSPLYVDIDGLISDGAVQFFSSDDDGIPLRTLVPIGTAGTASIQPSLRGLDIPLGSGDFNIAVGSKLTVRLYYRSAEDGEYGPIVPVPGGAWTNDCRCTLYIELQ